MIFSSEAAAFAQKVETVLASASRLDWDAPRLQQALSQVLLLCILPWDHSHSHQIDVTPIEAEAILHYWRANKAKV